MQLLLFYKSLAAPSILFVMEDRIILMDKPAGWSSFQVVAKVRGRLKSVFGHKVKVGHTGTLDPFATGLLILLSGKYTKKSSEFLKLDKEYITKIKLGFTSTTGDPEGEISRYPIEDLPEAAAEDEGANPVKTGVSDPCPKLDTVKSTLEKFTGVIEQRPPKFSAIKINGQRAYKLARKGADFEVPTRKVEIFSLEILEYKYPFLTLKCHVSSGTYIRTLVEDIGEALGVGAYCEELRRTRIGEYSVENATPVQELDSIDFLA